MTKKLNWLDKFAQEQAQKETMKKEASAKLKARVANQVIVNPEDVPGAEEGKTIDFNGEQFKVVDANFSDEMGAGVVLERAAGYEGLEGNPMDVSMGAPAAGMATQSTQGQQYHYDPNNNTQQTYSNEEDAQYGMSNAPATEQMIAGENATDRTTVPGRYTPSPGLNSAPAAPAFGAPGLDTANPVAPMATEAPMVPTEAPMAPVEEAPMALDAPVEAPAAEEAPVEEDEKENKILSKVKKSLPKKAKTTVTAKNALIITLASDVAKAITAEAEEILEDAEEAVKALVPSHLAAKALELLEEELEEEGVEALFNKVQSLSKTAGEEEELDEDELKDVIKKIAEAVIDELENVLSDADETMDEERESLANEEAEMFETEAKLKAMVERKLHAKGIYTRFARTAKKATKKTIAQKIRDARKSR